MGATAERPPLSLLAVLDQAALVLAQALGIEGRCRFEIVAITDGKAASVVEVWPHSEPGKLQRADLDKLLLPADLTASDSVATM